MTKKVTQQQTQVGPSVEAPEVLLTFLQQTKEGKFAKVDQASLKYARMTETGESFTIEDYEDCYYYSVS